MANPIKSLVSSHYSGQMDIKGSWVEHIHPNGAVFRGRTYEVVKRILDVTLALLVLPCVVPLCLLIALLIKLDSPKGSVIFVQDRTGKGGKRFKMYKFRSMVANAEELKEELAHLNKLKWPDFKVIDDPRITRVGHMLRKTSLDELPQLLNVLRGEMSLVGPRPISFQPETYDLWHTARLEAVPGVTGLWQIEGRGAVGYDERLRLDIAYIKRRCLWLDIQILVRTIPAVLARRGAY